MNVDRVSAASTIDVDEIGLSLGPPVPQLDEARDSLARAAGSSVTSLLGFSITLVVQTLPIELMAMRPEVVPGDIRSSLQLTLADLASDDVHGVVTFYAAEVGAFADLAAQVASSGPSALPNLRLDTALMPHLASGLTGFQKLTTINRAIGVLRSRGNNLRQANDILLRAATSRRAGLYESATEILSVTSAPIAATLG